MRPRFSPSNSFSLAATLLIAVVSVLMASASAPAQTAITYAVDNSSSELEQLLTRGRDLETQQRWGEVLTLYEEALRRFPRDSRLEQGHIAARIHYDLGRRYNDRSFTLGLTRLSERDALAVYSEVLLKISSHHVEHPQWQGLVARGTQTFDMALTDQRFLDHHLANVSPSSVQRFRETLRGSMRRFTVNDHLSARNAVAYAARLANRQLGLSPGAVIMEYTCGTTHALDNYSSFLTTGQLNEVYAQIEGNFVGLGIELKNDAGQLKIENVIANSPAEQSGLLAGHIILGVDGAATRDMSTDQAANLLQGEEGTVVSLTVAMPSGPQQEIRVRRAPVDVPSVEDTHMADQERGVGYFKLTSFQKTTSRDIDDALWQLRNQGMRSLIIDLRGNPGGLLTASVEVADKFLEGGIVVSTRGRNPNEDFVYSAHRDGTWSLPLIILIDHDSASASEILAGAIRDHGRGTVIGTRSYGKGSVQGIFPLNASNYGLRLTTSKFYSPKGRAYCNVGVEPDVVVQRVARPVVSLQDGKPLEIEQDDPVLDRALWEARRQMARRG